MQMVSEPPLCRPLIVRDAVLLQAVMLGLILKILR